MMCDLLLGLVVLLYNFWFHNMVTYFHDSFRLILVLRNRSVHCLILLLLTWIFIIIIIIIIIIEFLTSQRLLRNIHLSWDVVINRIMFCGLICSLKTFL